MILIVGLSTLLALLLVFSLSLRLRQQEIDTIFKLGCNRATIARLIFAEILIIMLISSLFCTGILLVTARFDEALKQIPDAFFRSTGDTVGRFEAICHRMTDAAVNLSVKWLIPQ